MTDLRIDNRFGAEDTRRKGCCSTHGLWMSQIDGWYKPDSGRQYTIVGCPREGCRIRAKAYGVYGPWEFVRWLLFEKNGLELVVLSKLLKTKKLAEKARLKYPDLDARKTGLRRGSFAKPVG